MLDVGCGMGRWGALIESNYWEAGLERAPSVDGCDAFVPNVQHCRRRGAYQRVWAQTMPSRLDGTWDTLLACELIEHIPDEQVTETLDLLEAAAANRVIVSTPNSPMYRPGHETPLGFLCVAVDAGQTGIPHLRGGLRTLQQRPRLAGEAVAHPQKPRFRPVPASLDRRDDCCREGPHARLRRAAKASPRGRPARQIIDYAE